jgi:hypothetical protein
MARTRQGLRATSRKKLWEKWIGKQKKRKRVVTRTNSEKTPAFPWQRTDQKAEYFLQNYHGETEYARVHNKQESTSAGGPL